MDDRVLRRAPVLEREIEAGKVERQPDDLRIEHAQRLFQEFLPGLVALEDDDRGPVHRADSTCGSSRAKQRSKHCEMVDSIQQHSFGYAISLVSDSTKEEP